METISERFDTHVKFCYLWESEEMVLIYVVSYVKHNAKITATVHICFQKSQKQIFDDILF